MDAAAIASEIQEIRERLSAISDERNALDADDFAGKAALMDEEHRLEARLSELKALATEAGAGGPSRG
jgi:hypothetical protein